MLACVVHNTITGNSNRKCCTACLFQQDIIGWNTNIYSGNFHSTAATHVSSSAYYICLEEEYCIPKSTNQLWHFTKICILWLQLLWSSTIGIGASPAGSVLAGPLFRQFNEIHYRYILKIACVFHLHLLQPDHFKSPSYASLVFNAHYSS